MEVALVPPTDRLDALARGAAAARLAASALRWLAACAVGFAGLLLLALVLASFERGAGQQPAGTSASAYLDFDLAVLRELASRSLSGEASAEAHRALSTAWSGRPDWQLPEVQAGPVRLAPVLDAVRPRTGASLGDLVLRVSQRPVLPPCRDRRPLHQLVHLEPHCISPSSHDSEPPGATLVYLALDV